MKKKIIAAFLAIICFEISLFSILINIAWRLECINAMQQTHAIIPNNSVAFLAENDVILFSTSGTVLLTIILMFLSLRNKQDK